MTQPYTKCGKLLLRRLPLEQSFLRLCSLTFPSLEVAGFSLKEIDCSVADNTLNPAECNPPVSNKHWV